jgi:oxygen-independent coproporphyrinogen III oxidase
MRAPLRLSAIGFLSTLAEHAAMPPESPQANPLIDFDLLRRYDGAGPRYTSYPTTLHFREAFGEEQLRRCAWRSNVQALPRNLSLYVHIPFCSSPCFYCGCNRRITRQLAEGERYVDRVLQEVRLVAPLFDRRREVIQLHLGGGTPNFLRPAQLARLLAGLGRGFRFSNAAERDFSIELDPRFVLDGDLAALAQLGFNRVSLGVQDFDPAVQRAINRLQDVDRTLTVIAASRRSGMRSVNVDLIYGLPRQTAVGFLRTLDTVISARPERVAVYGYAHLPVLFKAQRQIAAADLPAPAARVALLQLAVERLGAADYRYIGMDHFALPGDDLSHAQEHGQLHRNFMGYTTHAGCDLIGLGVSAISHVGGSFSQNHRELSKWEAALDEGRLPVARGLELSADDKVRADVIQQLMCHGEIDIAAIERLHSVDFSTYFSEALQRMPRLVADGLAIFEPAFIRATPRGRLLLRAIAMCFDRYLAPTLAGSGTAFSKIL